jgi:hypothetical protein
MSACVIYSTQFQEVVIRSIPISDAVASVNGRGTAWYVWISPSCPQTGYLNWFGIVRAKQQGHPAIYEDKRGFQNEPGVSHLKPDRRTSCYQASSSSISSNASYEEEVFQCGSSVKWCGVKRKVASEVLMCGRVCVCVRACVYACARVCSLVFACVCVCV